jgi:hypothetical protein
MKRTILAAMSAAILALGFSAAPAAARNYDCSKPGNANKAVCKGATPAAKPSSPAPAAPRITATRNYDCAKPGNANKAVCKGPVTAAPSAPAPQPSARHYDCSKPGNANKAVCKGSVAAAPSAPTARTAPSPRVTPSVRTPTAAPSATTASGPSGASAKCRDGSLSHSAHRQGTCSQHGGVATWY